MQENGDELREMVNSYIKSEEELSPPKPEESVWRAAIPGAIVFSFLSVLSILNNAGNSDIPLGGLIFLGIGGTIFAFLFFWIINAAIIGLYRRQKRSVSEEDKKSPYNS